MRRSRTLFGAALAVYAFLYVPLLLVAVGSFNAARLGSSWTGFTLDWYRRLFADERMLAAAGNSLVIALAATAISVVLGTLAGLGLARYRSRALGFLVVTPMAVPDILTGVSLLLFFVLIHLTLGMASVVLAHVSFCISFVALVVRATMANLDPNLVEAARDLGASPGEAYRRIVVPVIAPGIMAGGLLAFTLSIDDFVITFFTAGVGTTTLPLQIYSMIKVSITPEVNAVSTLLMLVTLSLVVLAARLAPFALRSGE
jgi:spermidine/putrescine transport system permease protein